MSEIFQKKEIIEATSKTKLGGWFPPIIFFF